MEINKQIKLAFATCVKLGLSCIEEIYRLGGNLDLLITLKDNNCKDKSGRIYLDKIAEEKIIPLIKIDNINDDEVIVALKKNDIDWFFIIGWSQLAKKKVLEAPKKGCIGMHPTLLPKGRGRAAIPWAIIKGLRKTGVTIFKIDVGIDTGDIIGQGIIEIDKNTTATELYKEVNQMHIDLLSKYWNSIVNDNIILSKQDEKDATEWPARKPKDGEIKENMTMDEADRLVRAVTKPYPGAFYNLKNEIIRIWSAKVTNQSKFKSNNTIIKLNDGYLIPNDYEIETKEARGNK